MTEKILLTIVFVILLATSCSPSTTDILSKKYVPEARDISDTYGLDDASISLTVLQENSNPNEVIYSLKINSRKFSNLSNKQKYMYLYDINKLVFDSEFKVSPVVISGSVYQLSTIFENAYTKNNSPVFPFGAPTDISDDKMVFNPPVKPELISNTDLDFFLAGDTISYLVDYEKYHWSLPYEERARLNKIYDEGYVYFISENANILLLEIDGDFAKIQLLENASGKQSGTVGWIRTNNVKSYPTP